MKILQLSINLFIVVIVSFTLDCWLSFPGKTETVNSLKRSSPKGLAPYVASALRSAAFRWDANHRKRAEGFPRQRVGGVPLLEATAAPLSDWIKKRSPQSQIPRSSQANNLDFSGDGRPGKRTGGGSRSLCPATAMPLTALVPDSNQGTTVSDRPSLWFYVPYASQQAAVGEFVLQDKQENDVYRQTFTPPPTPGLVSFQIPQNAPPLEVDRTYHWYFKLYCGDSSSTANFVEGWIIRMPISPELKIQLESQNPVYQAYGNSSLWFDSLDSLAQLRLHQDNSQLESDWHKLLSSEGVKLERLSDKPLLGTVTNIREDK